MRVCVYTSWSERVSPPLLSQPPACVIPASCPHNLISLPRSAGTLHARVCVCVCECVCMCPGRWGWCQTESINCSPSVCAAQCVCVRVCEPLIPCIHAPSLFLWICIHIWCVYICICAFSAFIFFNIFFSDVHCWIFSGWFSHGGEYSSFFFLFCCCCCFGF